MKLNDLKKELKEMGREELCEIITDLFKSNKSVKDFLSYHLRQSDEKLMENYKSEIKKAINPEKGQKIKLAKARKILSDLKKIGGKPDEQVKLMFFYIEQGLIFSKKLGYTADSFMSSLFSVYQSALKLIKSEYLPEDFIVIAGNITADVYGTSSYWGNCFQEQFNNAFPEIQSSAEIISKTDTSSIEI
jgi:hypothetical protein